MLPREIQEELETKVLAEYAQLSSKSLGREHKESECPLRTCFYRDLGRIVHSTAFRLLEYKSQVFLNHEGDYYRTRLTHTIEVSQMARGLAKILRVNEDLAHTIALAHDLGHAPFGHPGEAVLDKLMGNEGGFEHNWQSYRVVTELEERYPNFPGLNLTYEVREGIIMHSTDYDKPMLPVGFKKIGYPTIEAQIVNYADQIAFMNHDLDDGIHWGMLSMKSLNEVKLWAETYKEVCEIFPTASDRIKRCRTISDLIGKLITDLKNETEKRLQEYGIKTLEDVRKKGGGVVSFSAKMKKMTDEAKEFLYNNVYRYPAVVEMRKNTGKVLTNLFNAYSSDPSLLPKKYFERFKKTGSKRVICDYIAGMTDRFAFSAQNKIGVRPSQNKIGVRP